MRGWLKMGRQKEFFVMMELFWIDCDSGYILYLSKLIDLYTKEGKFCHVQISKLNLENKSVFSSQEKCWSVKLSKGNWNSLLFIF